MQELMCAVACGMALVAQASVAAVDGEAILDRVDKNLAPESYEMYRKLISIEPDGRRKEFVLYNAKQGRDSIVGAVPRTAHRRRSHHPAAR